MIVFQWIAIPLLLLLLAAAELFALRQRRGSAVWCCLRLGLWAVAAGLIAWPAATSEVARLLGIGRGTDLMAYVFMLTTPLALFHLYAKHFSLQREIVELARREALRAAVAGRGLRTEWMRPEAIEYPLNEHLTGRCDESPHV
ncbi:MAG: DUF2304 domain-containing protein [Planctomycetaceae bacterium]